MHDGSKFRQNRSNDCVDMAIFKVAVVHHLGYVANILVPPTRTLGSLYHQANFVWNPLSFHNMIMKVQILRAFGWQMLIHAPTIGAWGQFDPQSSKFQVSSKSAERLPR